jgi:hypothetical protein
MSGMPDTAQCRKCGYLLRGLTRNRCPECGQEFRPGDPSTYRLPGRFNARRWSRITYVAFLLTVVCFAAACFTDQPLRYGYRVPAFLAIATGMVGLVTALLAVVVLGQGWEQLTPLHRVLLNAVGFVGMAAAILGAIALFGTIIFWKGFGPP